MRIDKFLKISRIIKRRSVAADACDSGRIEINGSITKPSKNIKIGDIVTVTFGDNLTTFKVLSIDEHQTKNSATEMYEIISVNGENQ